MTWRNFFVILFRIRCGTQAWFTFLKFNFFRSNFHHSPGFRRTLALLARAIQASKLGAVLLPVVVLYKYRLDATKIMNTYTVIFIFTTVSEDTYSLLWKEVVMFLLSRAVDLEMDSILLSLCPSMNHEYSIDWLQRTSIEQGTLKRHVRNLEVKMQCKFGPHFYPNEFTTSTVGRNQLELFKDACTMLMKNSQLLNGLVMTPSVPLLLPTKQIKCTLTFRINLELVWLTQTRIISLN